MTELRQDSRFGGPFKVAIAYCAIAALWITLSAVAIEWIAPSRLALRWLWGINGLLFVAVTSVLLFLFVKRRVYTLPSGRVVAVYEDATAGKQAEEALRQREALLEMMSLMARIGGWEFDAASLQVTWSKEVARIFELNLETKADVESGFSFFSGESRRQIEAAVKKAVESGTPYDLELEMNVVSGAHKWVRVVGVPVMEDGRTVKVRGTVQDITERKEADAALLEAARTWNATFDAMNDAVWVADLNGRIVRCNQALARMIDKPLAELSGRPCWEVIHGTDEPIEGCPLRRMRRTRRREQIELVHGQRKLLAIVDPLLDDEGGVAGGVHVLADVTMERRARDTLGKSRHDIRNMVRRLAEAEESERKRLARELHDQVGQTLSAIGINLSIAGQMAQNGPIAAEAICERLGAALQQVEETASRIRNIGGDLRPLILDDYGLLHALQWYAGRFSHDTGIPVQVVGEEFSLRASPESETAFYRIAQEALTNVAKHAQATSAVVDLEELDGGGMRMTVSDDGAGFDPEAHDEAQGPRGLGLVNMVERADAFGGTCRVESVPGRGTRVIVQIGGTSG